MISQKLHRRQNKTLLGDLRRISSHDNLNLKFDKIFNLTLKIGNVKNLKTVIECCLISAFPNFPHFHTSDLADQLLLKKLNSHQLQKIRFLKGNSRPHRINYLNDLIIILIYSETSTKLTLNNLKAHVLQL
ncbi:hypothetical protein A3Q56_04180 [Intoshia linei]|uniref:Uncharacterized protein n=1 Tax=Intoshia linei TaxID=1819745 RepID=A0A177B399_9BILA|nr:hypothetical protein A3Q56_04180 [Intoshia linei]